jgi:hypothetical protein
LYRIARAGATPPLIAKLDGWSVDAKSSEMTI